ncbi:hypothetical protein B0J11DRAFT_287723 [Dendryphion nanum]|uniref:Uncharacterized protein n=1 Tax=Dendryphion nanum TaxID=256645 RepID=A0A9P9DYL4_9PLEO|nr:hypothetical protein B0J11DRAFT_287723 [Dendryphion nanum]
MAGRWMRTQWSGLLQGSMDPWREVEFGVQADRRRHVARYRLVRLLSTVSVPFISRPWHLTLPAQTLYRSRNIAHTSIVWVPLSIPWRVFPGSSHRKPFRGSSLCILHLFALPIHLNSPVSPLCAPDSPSTPSSWTAMKRWVDHYLNRLATSSSSSAWSGACASYLSGLFIQSAILTFPPFLLPSNRRFSASGSTSPACWPLTHLWLIAHACDMPTSYNNSQTQFAKLHTLVNPAEYTSNASTADRPLSRLLKRVHCRHSITRASFTASQVHVPDSHPVRDERGNDNFIYDHFNWRLQVIFCQHRFMTKSAHASPHVEP